MLSIRLLLLCLCGISANAQDPFEIHIYEYEPLRRGEFTYETHLNYVLKGSRGFDGTLAPMRNQLHFTSEITAGLNEQFAVGFMLLTPLRPDHPLEYAGWRVLPHFDAPKSWHLPVSLGLVTEFSFQNNRYEENSRRVEVRPIVEKHFGRLELDLNPVLEHALHGPGTKWGWILAPAGRISLRVPKPFTASLEYYSSLEPARSLSALPEQIHQVFPGGDLKLGEKMIWSFGVGFGVTGTGSRLIIKSRFEFELGKK